VIEGFEQSKVQNSLPADSAIYRRFRRAEWVFAAEACFCDHAARIFTEDFAGASDISGDVQADTTLTQMNPTRNSSLTPLTA
jgi:hypothetical protein